MNIYHLFFVGFLLVNSFSAYTQAFAGHWEGQVGQADKSGYYTYQLDLTERGKQVTGTAVSATPDKLYEATFKVTGYWDGSRWILQEVEQLKPETPKWCLKFATLTQHGDYWEGDWTADGCKPGTLKLWRARSSQSINNSNDLPLSGSWQGRLSQSDRDYGFYYTLNLKEDGTGTSAIVSDGPGGNATHQLKWTFNAKDNAITLRESEVIEKSNPSWRWCIKSAVLQLKREPLRLSLDGPWQGFIEGYDETTGTCASGQLTLEKPVLPPQVEAQTRPEEDAYTKTTGRQVKVNHVVEVQNKNVRLRVWDNGTVDGDVATLFLNGKRILTKHRVSKSKVVIPVTLNDDNNVLILHAEDLGEIIPNTVAVSVDDGKREQVIILSSNLDESGAILIRIFKME